LSLANRNELAGLTTGDAWLAGAGLWIDRSGAGRGVLTSPSAERGVRVDLAPDGTIVVGDDDVVLDADVENSDFSEGSDMSASKGDGSNALTEAALDAPVVVRIEIGSVSMSAREWAALRPGDVIESGRRINEPVVLRVAGREVARGELVDVEGEIGVRVREILTGGASG